MFLGIASLLWVLVTGLPNSPETTGPVAPPPGALQAISRALLEEKSSSQQAALEEFAVRYDGQVHGVLAHLALGYYAYQEKKYPQASRHLEAARRIPSPVQDYAEYYLARSQVEANHQEEAAKVLEGFARRFPSSPLASRAILRQAETLLALKKPAEVIRLLSTPPLTLPQAEADFLLAEAHRNGNQLAEAVKAYRDVYYLSPTSSRADEAFKKLVRLQARMGKAYPSATLEQRKIRAGRLYQAGKWQDAEKEYRVLVEQTTGAERDGWRVRLGVCQYQRRATWPALETLLRLEVSEADLDAERLYTLVALYRRLDRKANMEQQIQALAEKYPKSPWYAKALFWAGNYYFLEGDLDEADQRYRKLYERFPQGEDAETAHWRVTWRAYRERRVAPAKGLLQEHVRNYPSNPNASAALYYLGRLSEPEAAAVAAAYYGKIVETFPNYYYGLLARQRLASLAATGVTGSGKAGLSLNQVQRPNDNPVPASASSNNGKPFWNRAKLLESAWLMDLAVGELRAALERDSADPRIGVEIARLEQERGQHHVALRYAKQFISGYFARQPGELDRATWDLLFPLPWWEQIQELAKGFELDPHVVAGLIRQESEFNPQARSRSNARGLMQLLPSTARLVARKVPDREASRYNLSNLYRPEMNLVYGTYYLREVLDRFGGSLEQALAAYNAGPRRVEQWLTAGSFEEPAEFVESIPFTETRNYVQAVLRNAALYRQLYPAKN